MGCLWWQGVLVCHSCLRVEKTLPWEPEEAVTKGTLAEVAGSSVAVTAMVDCWGSVPGVRRGCVHMAVCAEPWHRPLVRIIVCDG